jgi:NAD(P)-dependent dehydrogenase (short-subunit alcohol dehydrogenase family)
VTGRRVWVTGASSGIGAATAERLADRGWRVLAGGRDAGRLDALAAPRQGRLVPLVGDLTDEGDVAGMVAVATAEPLHGIVHAAGVIALGPVADAAVEDFAWQWRVNLLAPYRLTQLLLPALRAERGHVVFVNSGAGRRANAGWAAYAATKFGLRALADALRAEETGHGVRVTSIYPGRTDTPMQRTVFEAEGRGYDASGLVPATVVADAVCMALETPPPGLLSDLEVRPG